MSNSQQTNSDTETSGTETSDIPPQINSEVESAEFEDIELPQNSGHKAIIEVHYKIYFYIIVGLFVSIVGLLFGSGIISINVATLIAEYGTGVIIVTGILLYLYGNRANS